MINHVSFGVADLARAIAFYDAVMSPLGHARTWTGDGGAEYGGAFAVFANERAGGGAPGGRFHLALTAGSRAAVDAFHAAGLRMGGSDEGAPGLRENYGAGYYAAFVRDLDGHKLEAVFHEIHEGHSPRS